MSGLAPPVFFLPPTTLAHSWNLRSPPLRFARRSGTDKVGTVDKAKYSNWHGGNMDPDAMKQHQRQLKR